MNLLKLMAYVREEAELTQLADQLAELTVPQARGRLSDSVTSMGKNEARGYIRVRAQQVLTDEAERFLAPQRLSPTDYSQVLELAGEMTIERVLFSLAKSQGSANQSRQAEVVRRAA